MIVMYTLTNLLFTKYSMWIDKNLY